MNSSGLSSEKRIKVVIKGNSMFDESTKGYSITSIVLAFMVVALIIFNVTYILITRRSKISKNDKEINTLIEKVNSAVNS